MYSIKIDMFMKIKQNYATLSMNCSKPYKNLIIFDYTVIYSSQMVGKKLSTNKFVMNMQFIHACAVNQL